MGTRTSRKIEAVFVVLLNHSHRWSSGSDRLTLLLRLLPLALTGHHLFDHSGKDMLPQMVLPEDLGLSLSFPYQASNQHTFLFVVLDERVDVLRHFLRHSTTPNNVLFVDLHDHCHLLEVVAVGGDFFSEADHQGF